MTDAFARAKDGDRDALRVLYMMLYARDVRRFVTTIVRDPHDGLRPLRETDESRRPRHR